MAQKAIKEALPTVGMLPPSIELAHHNAVAGLDGWRNVAALVVVGCTAPAPASVARIAEALTGSALQGAVASLRLRDSDWFHGRLVLRPTGQEVTDRVPSLCRQAAHRYRLTQNISWFSDMNSLPHSRNARLTLR